ncbi:MAG: hypothetical protein PHN19_00035 [Patescibacteria group bacterium]|nr:hypothetical protein [Patescibacteria group bacterium]
MEQIKDRSEFILLVVNPYRRSYSQALRDGREIEFQIWDGRIVAVRNYKEKSITDFRTSKYWFPEHIVEPMINELLRNGTPFIISCGNDEDRCTIIWELRRA